MSFPNEVPESGTFIERELSYMLYEFLGKELSPTIFAQQTHRGSALRSILDGFHFKDELCSLYTPYLFASGICVPSIMVFIFVSEAQTLRH